MHRHRRNTVMGKPYEEYYLDQVTPEDISDHELVKVFQTIDIDRSGTISREELTSALQKFGVDTAHIDFILTAVDENQDGAINFEEFFHFWKKFKSTSSPRNSGDNPSPQKPNSQKSSRRMFRKREMAILREMNLSPAYAAKAIEVADHITKDDITFDISDTSSERHDKEVLRHANMLYTKKTKCAASKVTGKVLLSKPRQLLHVQQSTFTAQCKEMRAVNHDKLYNSAIRNILRLRKVKVEDFEAELLHKLDGLALEALEAKKLIAKLANSNVKKWVDLAMQNAVLKIEEKYQRELAEKYALNRACDVLRHAFANYHRRNFKIQTIHGVIMENRRRIQEEERLDEERFQKRIADRRFREECEKIRYEFRNSSSKTLSPTLEIKKPSSPDALRSPSLGPFYNNIIDRYKKYDVPLEPSVQQISMQPSSADSELKSSWREEALVSKQSIKSLVTAKSDTRNTLKMIESGIFTEYNKSWNDPVIRHKTLLFKGLSFS